MKKKLICKNCGKKCFNVHVSGNLEINPKWNFCSSACVSETEQRIRDEKQVDFYEAVEDYKIHGGTKPS